MKILLIIPCFNEENRLKFADYVQGKKFNREKGIELTYLFANDGSSDATERILKEHAFTSNDLVFSNHVNRGKANVIQEAFQKNYDLIAKNGYDWIGYWDADLATPLSEIPWMIRYLEFSVEPEVHAIWGSRISRLGSVIKRQIHRHYLGRIFVTLVSNVLKVKAYDSQCGAKLFTPDTAKIAFKENFISRWIFDVEILLRIQEKEILEYPLRYWEDIPGSKVKVFKEIFRVAKDLMKIRKKYIARLD